MANILKRFNQAVAGSQSKYADYVSKVAPSGDFQRIEELKVILNSWNNILITPTRSALWDPEYGSDLYKLVFEPADDTTISEIIRETRNKLIRYDDRAIIKDINVTYLTNLKGFTVDILVIFQGQQSELSVTIDETLYFKFLETVGSGSG